MRPFFITIAFIALSIAPCHSQVIADKQTVVSVATPTFARNAGPVVAVDSAHHNYQTINDRYAPLAELLINDGFRVVDSKTAFTKNNLAAVSVLVIANAFPVADGVPPPVPTPSAFSPRRLER